MSGLPSGTVTFLFTDIEGSTKLAREHAETWESSRSRHHQILREAIESNNGFIFQIIGDAFCAAFHKAGDALNAAVKAQQGLQNESWGDCVIRVRMGIHTGEAEAHDNEYKGYLTLSLVQRLMSAGHGEQILLSGTTEILLRGQLFNEVMLRDMGEHKFKDVPYPVRVFQVTAPDLQKEFPALRALDEFPSNLPSQLTSFIGREKEVADVERLLANTRLLTLIGPGGTGKTRLSLQVAAEVLHSFSHGVWLVELAPFSDPSFVPAAALAALNLPAEVHRPAIDMLCDYLHKKETLLVLDNCEHLIEACAKMADRLLHTAPKLRILASSREALGIAGEVSYRVPSLALPDIKHLPTLESLSQYEAVKLFIDRARTAQPTFHVTDENAPAVAQICHRLDGIPLALELAAAKVRVLSVDQIAKRLDDRFRLLTGGSRTALERQQTLRATLDWSHNLLPENEQVLFRRLSVFVNGWTLEAPESVCSNGSIHNEDVLELLEQLVNKSLVLAEEWHTETRFHMLETMRQYADEKLTQACEKEALRDRHLEYFLRLAENAAPYLIRPEQLEWLDRLEADLDNLRLAFEWALNKEAAEPSLRLCAALGDFWSLRCYWQEGTKWLNRALAKPSQPSNSENLIRVRALYQEAALAQHLDDLERMKTSAAESFALAQTGTDRRDLAIARFYVAYRYWRDVDFQTAYILFEESLVDFHSLQDLYWQAICENFLSLILVSEGKMRLTDEVVYAVERAREVGERLNLAMALIDYADSEWRNHRIEPAQKYLKEAQDLLNELGHKGWINVYSLFGLIAHSLDDYQQAKENYQRAIELLALIGEKTTRSSVLYQLGILSRDEGDLDQARTYAEESLHLAREVGEKSAIGTHSPLVGYLDVLQGRLDAAKSNFIEALTIAKEIDFPDPKYSTLCLLASAFANRQSELALRLASAVHIDYTNTLHEPLYPLFQREVDRILTQAKLQLDQSAIDTAWAQGENLTIDQALDLALKTLDEI